jgi:hypothetical protein
MTHAGQQFFGDRAGGTVATAQTHALGAERGAGRAHRERLGSGAHHELSAGQWFKAERQPRKVLDAGAEELKRVRAHAQRQAEMGVRIALGATGGDVVSILVGSGAKLAAIGLACGLAIALGVGRLMESMLYGIRPLDPLAISGAMLLLGGAALLAELIPALRASRVDPALALREE